MILDYLMPAMDGEMLGRAIRADERLRGCALILATSDMRSRRTDGVTPVRVLLAEDNPVNQKLAQRLLERAGHTVTLVDNGRLAVEAVSANSFDVVLMDVQMPNMDGLEATRRLRASERGRRLHVVAMTANAMQGDRERCIDAGMDDYVPKPVTPDYLARALEALTPART